MIEKQKNGIKWLEFELFQEFKELKAFVFCRHGGKSVNDFSSLNLGQTVGDDPELVQQNKKAVSECLEVDQLFFMQQCHGKEVVKATKEPPLADGLLTDQRGQALLVTHADCQAAIIYDPIRKALATVHSGWRGNVLNIYQETVNQMGAFFGSRPENLFVGISPSLGPQSAEFIHWKKEFPLTFSPFCLEENRFDLWELAKMQLMSAGVKEQHLQIAKIDTYQSLDFFSYRREKITGRNGTAAVMS
jgi:YfiH family protein